MTEVHYQQPSALRTRIINPAIRFFVLKMGMGSNDKQDLMRILRVKGRKSGRVYDFPLRIAIREGQYYILSMLGETQWVRNLRAADTAELIVGNQVDIIRSHEIEGEEKTAFLKWYCLHPEYEMRARFALKADTKNLTATELDRLARLYPVFRLEFINVAETNSMKQQIPFVHQHEIQGTNAQILPSKRIVLPSCRRS